ncbi:MAG: xylulokinase, partial [Firmicutes bacterium]|nr:xylulokinase [Bacillota bacterium]
MRYLLGVDFGGGSSKATLIDEEGHIITTAAEEYPMLYPHMGWAEQDLESLYQAFLSNIRNVLAKSQVDAKDIVAMAIDGATHIGVLLDENNQVIRPAIHWTDSRSAAEAAELAPLKERFIERC